MRYTIEYSSVVGGVRARGECSSARIEVLTSTIEVLHPVWD
jgi:hypothetical protein